MAESANGKCHGDQELEHAEDGERRQLEQSRRS